MDEPTASVIITTNQSPSELQRSSWRRLWDILLAVDPDDYQEDETT